MVALTWHACKYKVHDDEVELHVLGCQLTCYGQTETTAECCFISTETIRLIRTETIRLIRTETIRFIRTETIRLIRTETIRLIRTESPGQPPHLSHSP